MTVALYLFKFPVSWALLFAFGVCFNAKVLSLGEARYEQGGVYQAAVTLPMAYMSAMGLVQYLHRRLLALGLQSPLSLPRPRESRKDRPVPALRPGAPLGEVWQAYCADADYVEKVLREAREAFQSQTSAERESGLSSGAYAQTAIERYSAREVPLSEKDGARVQRCPRLGALIDGLDGRVAVLPPSLAWSRCSQRVCSARGSAAQTCR